MSKRIKNLITAELQNKFKGAEAVVVVDYKGISSTASNKLRVDLRKKKVKMTVVRNAMAAKALENAGLKGAGKLLTGTNAVVYGGESVVDVARELVEQAKTLEKLIIKGSVVEGQLLDAKQTQALAKLPSKKELQANISGQITGPSRKLAGQIVAPGRKIAGIIKSVIEKKEKEGAAAPAAEAPAPATA